MSNHSKRKGSQQGFSLLEVLVAVVILSFGLLALAGLQVSLFKASADVKAQSVGLALANEKLEYFRGYPTMTDYLAIDSGNDGASFTVGGTTYTRDWTVTRYASPTANVGTAVFTDPGSNTAALGSGYVTNNEFKRVRVNVTWTDAGNVAQKVTLEDVIAALDPGDSAKVGKLSSGTTNRGPVVRIFDPGQQQDGVIPIGIGTGDANTAATNPKPLVNGTNVIETRFDVLTYSGLNGVGANATAIEQSRVETSLVACACDYGQAPAGFGKRPTYWDGYKYTEPEDSTTAALAGEALAAVNTQSNLCSICCRDHHDPSTLAVNAPRFDPRDSTHKDGHFLLTGSTLSAQKTTGTYTEACRVIRVNGVYRVAADMYNDYQNLLDTNSMAVTPDVGKPVYIPTAAKTTSYQNFVKSYLDSRLAVTGSPASDTKANRNVLLSLNVDATSVIENTTGINPTTSPQTISIQPSFTYVKNSPTKWLHLRGLFVDYLEDSAIQAIKDAKSNCGSATLAAREACVLPVLPFTSLNLTELGNWTPISGTEIVVAGNNFDFSTTLTKLQPIRGATNAVNSATDGATNNALATLRSSNSGLTTLPNGISTNDAGVAVPATWTATQPFLMSGFSGSPTGGTYVVQLAASPSQYVYQAAAIGTMYLNSSFGNGVSNCNYTVSTGDPINCSTSDLTAQTLTVGGYNYSVTNLKTNQTSLGDVALSCTNTVTNATVLHTFNGQGTLGARTCKNWQVTASTGGGAPGTPTAGTDGLTSESTPIVFASGITNGATINFTLVPQADSLSYTCTYNDQGTNQDNNYTVVTKSCP